MRWGEWVGLGFGGRIDWHLFFAGDLCGECSEGRGVTLDLTSCSDTSCYIGLGVFLFLCECLMVSPPKTQPILP